MPPTTVASDIMMKEMRISDMADLKGTCLTRRRFVRLGLAAGLGLAAFPLFGCSGIFGNGNGAADGDTSGGASGSAGDAASQSGTTSLVPTVANGADSEQRERVVFAFDTVVSLKASATDEMMDALEERCNYFESIFSRTIETSDIGRINAAGGSPVEVAAETADIIVKALDYCAESEGRFDITIGAVSELWDFKKGVVPDAAALEEAIKHVDYRLVAVDGTKVALDDAAAKLDLGGIAKGYIADDLCQMMAQSGVTSGFVNLGGNVKTVGCRPDGTAWHVGIQDPNSEEGTVIAAVYSEGTSAVTSGLYERAFEADGKRYWHILDPKTGYPVETDLVSATVFSEASLDGDGYTKPLFMMGAADALSWLEAKDGIEGFLVDADGAITQTSGCAAELA